MTEVERINELEKMLNESERKYGEAIYTIWLLDTHEEAKDLLKKHGLWGQSVQADTRSLSTEKGARL